MTNKYIIKSILLLLTIVLYSSSFAQGIRMHYEEMTDNERDDLMDAYWSVGGSNGTSGKVHEIATFHDENFTNIHFNDIENDVFFAWHRQASHDLERTLKADAGSEWITIPYWDWTLSSSESDPLWDDNWLGQFNDDWNLNRQFDNNWDAPNPHLPSQDHIDIALTEENFFQFSRNRIEQNLIHAGGHVWLGGNPPSEGEPSPGVMANPNSPKDPAFFFHHNMVDKIWADWHEDNGSSSEDYYIRTDLPLYTSVDPDDIVDPRSLGIFYAESGLATLDNYTVNNTFVDSEKYGYQFTIEAKDDFIIPSGNDAEFRSCNEIILSPGFEARSGSSFFARIDGDCNFTTGFNEEDEQQLLSRNKVEETDVEMSPSEIGLRNYPNPFTQSTTIEFELPEITLVQLEIFDISGRLVHTLIKNNLMDIGIHKIQFSRQGIPDGIYLYRLSTENETIISKMILGK